MGLEQGGTQIFFPALTTLSIARIDWGWATREMIHAFNLSLLRSLVLYNCQNSQRFLHGVTELGLGKSLRSVELTIDDRDAEGKNFPVKRFLEHLENLEELFLLIVPGMGTESYLSSIVVHKSTLRSLVYHERLDKYAAWENDLDSTDLDFFENRVNDLRRGNMIPAGKSRLIPAAEAFGRILEEIKLEFLGLCHSPVNLVSPYRRYITYVNEFS